MGERWTIAREGGGEKNNGARWKREHRRYTSCLPVSLCVHTWHGRINVCVCVLMGLCVCSMLEWSVRGHLEHTASVCRRRTWLCGLVWESVYFYEHNYLSVIRLFFFLSAFFSVPVLFFWATSKDLFASFVPNHPGSSQTWAPSYKCHLGWLRHARSCCRRPLTLLCL